MEIRSVTTKSDLKRFVKLPYSLSGNDPVWVPPLRSEQFGQFDLRLISIDHCGYRLLLLLDHGKGIDSLPYCAL